MHSKYLFIDVTGATGRGIEQSDTRYVRRVGDPEFLGVAMMEYKELNGHFREVVGVRDNLMPQLADVRGVEFGLRGQGAATWTIYPVKAGCVYQLSYTTVGEGGGSTWMWVHTDVTRSQLPSCTPEHAMVAARIGIHVLCLAIVDPGSAEILGLKGWEQLAKALPDLNARVAFREGWHAPSRVDMFRLAVQFDTRVHRLLAKGWAPMHFAVIPRDESKQVAAIEQLALMGADVNVADDIGRTPLHIAAHLGRAKACRALMSAGANPQAKTSAGRRAVGYAREPDVRELLTTFGHGHGALRIVQSRLRAAKGVQ